MKSTHTVLALFAAALFLPLAAVGQDEQAPTMVASNAEAIDDIVVVGNKSMSELRRDVFEAEEDFYSIFNKLNDDKEYNVKCYYERPTGSHIRNHVCRARFVTKAYSRHAARNRNDLSRVANQGANIVPAEKTAKYQEKMETLVAANPELEAALIRYNTARAQFFAVREERANN